MEKCFIIESSAELHKKYYDWVELRNKNNEIVKKFVSENITERYPFTYITKFGGAFGITLTDEEYEKFKPQLKKDYTWTDNGKLYTFKKNSDIGKRYAQLDIKPANKPYVPLEIGLMGGRWRLFDYEKVLYVTIDSERLGNEKIFPDGWQEISKSEFYAVIDKIEREEK